MTKEEYKQTMARAIVGMPALRGMEEQNRRVLLTQLAIASSLRFRELLHRAK